MQKLKALYFPHTDISSPVIVKNALLLWDAVETIVPERRWIPRRDGLQRQMREAAELVVAHRVPTNPERHTAHSVLTDLVQQGVAERLLKQPPGQHRRRNEDYLI